MIGLRLRNEWRLACEVPRWAWRFYRRHLAVIVGLSLIPSVQRLVVVNWDEHIPGPVAVASEVVVAAVRLVLLGVIWCLAVPRGPLRWGTFASEHWPSLVIQGGLLAAAALVFNTGLDEVVRGLLPEHVQQTYLAVVLFVKNPTIIAFTFVWMVGMVRQLLRPPSTSDVSEPTGRRVPG